MWPTTASSGAASPTRAIEEPIPSVESVGERRLLAPDGGRRSPRSPRGPPARSSLSRSSGVPDIELASMPRQKTPLFAEISNSVDGDGSNPHSDRPGHRSLERDRRGDRAAPGPRAGRRAGPRRPARGAAAGAGRLAALPGDLRRRRPHRRGRPVEGARPRRRAPRRQADAAGQQRRRLLARPASARAATPTPSATWSSTSTPSCA